MVVCRSRELMCLGMGFTLSLVMSYVQFFDQGLFELDHHHRGFNSSSGCEQELANHVNQPPVPAIHPVAGGIEQKPEELRSKNYSYSERHVESTAPSTSDLVDLISHNRQIGNDVPIYIFKELMQKKRKIGNSWSLDALMASNIATRTPSSRWAGADCASSQTIQTTLRRNRCARMRSLH